MNPVYPILGVIGFFSVLYLNKQRKYRQKRLEYYKRGYRKFFGEEPPDMSLKDLRKVVVDKAYETWVRNPRLDWSTDDKEWYLSRHKDLVRND